MASSKIDSTPIENANAHRPNATKTKPAATIHHTLLVIVIASPPKVPNQKHTIKPASIMDPGGLGPPISSLQMRRSTR